MAMTTSCDNGFPRSGSRRSKTMTKMKKSILIPVLLGLAWLPCLSAGKQMIVPDTPTVLGTIFVSDGQIAIYDPDTQSYSLDTSLVIPGNPTVNAIHKMPNPGEYLFSPKDGLALGGADPAPLAVLLGSAVPHNDIVRFDGESGYSRFFCNAELGAHDLYSGSNIDAIYLNDGDLIISVDAATTTAGVTYEQNDLIRYERTGPGCGDWQVAGYEFEAKVLDGSGDPLIPSNRNVVGATRDGDQIFLALDTASTLGASDYNPYKPGDGELATWNVATETFTLNATFAGFPTSPNPFAHPNSVAEPPESCVGLGDPDITDQVVDLCGATWVTDANVQRFRIEWLPLGGAQQYKVFRGQRSDMSPSGLAFDVVVCTPNNFFIELADPLPSEAFFYLISADGGPLACGYGATACGGTCCDRVLLGPGDCP